MSVFDGSTNATGSTKITPMHAPATAPDCAGHHLRGRHVVHPPLDDAERAVEDPAEDPAADVPGEAAHHREHALGFAAVVASDPEPGRGAEQHHEQTDAFYEHALPSARWARG